MHTADCSFTGGNSNLNSCKWISHQNKNLKSFPNFKKYSHTLTPKTVSYSYGVCELAKLPICKQKHMLNYHHRISNSISHLRLCGVFLYTFFHRRFSAIFRSPFSESLLQNTLYGLPCATVCICYNIKDNGHCLANSVR